VFSDRLVIGNTRRKEVGTLDVGLVYLYSGVLIKCTHPLVVILPVATLFENPDERTARLSLLTIYNINTLTYLNVY